MRRIITGCAIVFIAAAGLSGCMSTPKPHDHAEADKGNEPLRGPWRRTKSLEGKSKNRDENGDTYACVDKECKVSRKVDEKKD
ncbi:MAG: hypothetical protein QM667_09905 [Asticcacaulis sp.]